ncbi:MAG: DUF4428 domain-containing protein [Ruminococcaceae bacterium]|nr:DUF4428 domain-containing protein [Oscillospiraceae bacterium]
MGLFDKKNCDFCGEKIGMLGNRKLEDGNMCKDCAKKLSPFCDDRRRSTVEQIRQHLQYREENKNALRAFSPTLTLGEDKKIYVDQMKGNFVVSRNKPGSWTEENPDVMPIASITSCGLDIDEDRDEIYTQNGQGQRVSYNPPQYKYYYNFKLKFLVNNPYFDDFEVKLNNFRVEGMGSMEYNRYQKMGMDIMAALGVNGAVNMTGGMGMQGGMPMNGAMGMNNMGYGQPNPYGQPMPQQGMYGQPQQMGYGQPSPYGQPMQGNMGYGQPNPYGQQMPQGNMGYQQGGYQQQNPYQQNTYGQNQQMPQNNAAFAQPASASWTCDCCGNVNEGAFCTGCGNKRG